MLDTVAQTSEQPASTAAIRSADQALIKSLTPIGGSAVEVGSVTAIVGGNNAGKTELLRDILRLAANFDLLKAEVGSDQEPQAVVLADLAFAPKLTAERVLLGLTVIDPEGREGAVVQGIGPNLKTSFRRSVGRELKNLLYRPVMSARSLWMTPLGALMPLRLSFVDLEDRRRLVAPTLAIGPLDGPENLLQVLQFAAPEVHAELDAAFGEIFEGVHIKLDDSQRVQLTLRVSASFPPALADPIQNVRQYSQIRNLADEGDAYQSVAAVLMATLLGRGRVLLFDQPSAFLQPEQARRLGRWLARRAALLSCQIFVATRDADLLQGLFDGESNVTVLRVSRRENLTRLQAVPQEQANALANTPLLACQEGLRLLMRDGVIVTPNETSRIFYQTVTSRCTDAENVGFVQSIDARNMGFVTGTLRQCGLPVCAVTELESLASEQAFAELVAAATGSPAPQPWMATRERLARHVESWMDRQGSASRNADVESFLDQVKSGGTTGSEMNLISPANALRGWEKVRRERLEWIPRELRAWVEEMLEDLKRKGVFVSPKGRLQNWIDVGGDGNDRGAWLTRALRSLEQGQCPAELRAFATEMVSFLKAAHTPARATRRSGSA